MRARKRSEASGWRRWFPIAVVLLILVLAPVLAYGQTADSVVVRWTAPGDDGNLGQASVYDLRVSESPIDSLNFGQATQVTGLNSPAPSGTRQKFVVRGLTPGTPYYFAIRTQDDAGNWSPLSNVARWNWVFDTAPPSAPAGLAVGHDPGQVTISWSPSPEPDLGGYHVYRATAAEGPFTLISTVLITTTTFSDKNLPANAEALWYRVSAVDVNGNESAESAPIAVALTAGAASDAVAVEEAYPNPSRDGRPAHIPIIVPALGASRVTMDIIDSGNHRVRRIELSNLLGGRREIVWDGLNDAGQTCAPGVYRGWLMNAKDRQTIRIVRVP